MTTSAGCSRCSQSCSRSSKHISVPESEPLSSSKDGILRERSELSAGSDGHWTREASRCYPIAAPLSHERGRHYLQRFWEKLPDPGQIVVFDRSWYGRVLGERVEGLASKRQWHRGY